MWGLPKLSILFFYRLIFRGKVFSIASWTLIIASALWTLICFFIILLQCGRHIKSEWTSSEVIKTNCMSGESVTMGSVVFDVLLGLLILTLLLFLV